MTSKVTFQELLEQAKQGTAYWVSRAIESFTEDLFVHMKTQGVTKAELARRLGKTPAYVTKILRGRSNFTIESMVTLARALDAEVEIRVTETYKNAHYVHIEATNSIPQRAPIVLFPQRNQNVHIETTDFNNLPNVVNG